MKLLLSLTLSWLIAFTPTVSTASTCCDTCPLMQQEQASQEEAACTQEVSDAEQKVKRCAHSHYPCDHQSTTSVTNFSAVMFTSFTVATLAAHITLRLYSHVPDNIYRPPIFAV